MSSMLLPRFLTACLLLFFSATSHAGEVLVAVAANFTAPMKQIAAQFEQDTGHTAILSFGATGQLYAQIINGAPFAILLSADNTTLLKLVENGMGVADTQFTYATGKLVLWSTDLQLVDAEARILRTTAFDKIAIADPRLAPYGAAAMAVIDALGLKDSLASRTVTGSNISQTFQFVASGNASLGFVALSQVFTDGAIKEGSGWIVPADMYPPISQDAILLQQGANNPAAAALLDYLRSDTAKAIISAFGYAVD